MAAGNSVNDEILEQRRKVLEEEGLKGKIKYFVYYYKWHAAIALFLLIFIVNFIVNIATKKDTALQVIFINGFPNVENEEFMDGFAQTININPKKEEALLDSSFYINPESPGIYDEQNMEKIFVMASAGVLDVCISDETYFETLAEGGYLLDLSTVFSEEEMEEYKDRIFYYDSPNNLAQGKEPVGLEITNAPKLVETQSFPNSKAYFCIIMNSEHVDNALAFLDYLESP